LVGQLANLGGKFGFGSQGGKRFQRSHKSGREDREEEAKTHEKFRQVAVELPDQFPLSNGNATDISWP